MMQRMTAVMIVTCFMFSSLIAFSQAFMSPILIVPGLRGSRLQAKMDVDKIECVNLDDVWKTYWVNLNPEISTECIKNVLSLQYNQETKEYSNTTGYYVKAVDLDSVESVEYLDEAKAVKYFHQMVEYFVSQAGYTRNSSIRAAPFDWRMAPASLLHQGYYDNVQSIIEEMYETENNTRVSIVAHSMGGPVSLYFLNKMDQTWKDKYIHAYIPLSGAWSGGNRGLLSFVSQIEINANWFLERFASTFPTMESAVWLLPDPDVWQDTVIVTTNNNTLNYTAQQYKELLNSSDYDRWVTVVSANGKLKAPNVTTHCFYGDLIDGDSTPEVFHYGYGYPCQQAYQGATNGPGDTVVNLKDSQICLQWGTQQTYSIYNQSFNFTHIEMVKKDEVFYAIHAVVNTTTSPTQSGNVGGTQPLPTQAGPVGASQPPPSHVGCDQPSSQPSPSQLSQPSPSQLSQPTEPTPSPYTHQILKSFKEKVSIGYYETVRKFTASSGSNWKEDKN